MATEIFYFTGTAQWLKARKPDEKYNNYSVDLYLDDTSMKVFKASGLQLEVKKDDKGEFVKFRRPHAKPIKNEMVEFGPPKILDKDGKTEFDGLVGNGSKVTIKVSVYDSMKGKGHRWESARIDELVPYGNITEGATDALQGVPF